MRCTHYLLVEPEEYLVAIHPEQRLAESKEWPSGESKFKQMLPMRSKLSICHFQDMNTSQREKLKHRRSPSGAVSYMATIQKRKSHSKTAMLYTMSTHRRIGWFCMINGVNELLNCRKVSSTSSVSSYNDSSVYSLVTP